ncbi:MAG: ATP-binding protein [Lachnospiraceae bacterium]|nr:ATP-binding protein [Lachnospiraceae bacterium]
MKTLRIEALTENLPNVLSFIDGELEANGCPIRVQMQIDIAVEEMYINIASYAYAPNTGDAQIDIDISGNDPKVATIHLYDSGVAFDPLAKPDPDITLSVDERAIGGLGIYMVKQTMDSVSYEYKNGKNHFVIVKNLVDEPDA